MVERIEQILIVSEYNIIDKFIIPAVKMINKDCGKIFDCLIIGDISDEQKVLLLSYFYRVYSGKRTRRNAFSSITKIDFCRYICNLREAATNLPDYKVINVFFHHYYYVLFTDKLRRKAKKLFITFLGSDFNEIEWYKHWCNRISVHRADAVFCNTPAMLNLVKGKYGRADSKNKYDVLDLLMEPFVLFKETSEHLTQETARLCFGYSKKVIVCGYNAAPITQHEAIVRALMVNEEKLFDYKIVFPMTYGHLAAETRGKVRRLMKNSKLDFEVITDYMPVEKLLALRFAADIFIHIQSRDQMASSMLEHLAAGSIVITGKWLPYEDLVKKGVFLIRINDPSELALALDDALLNYDEYKERSSMNRCRILEMTSWESIKTNWYKHHELMPAHGDNRYRFGE